MPRYDYECESCKLVFEVEQSITAEKDAVCPTCSLRTKNRLISGGTSFSLKGSGWAADNYSSAKKD